MFLNPPKTLPKRTIYIFVLGSICVSLLIGFLGSKEQWLISRLDHFFNDQFTKSLPTDPPPQRVAVVDIDEASLSMVGQWPWPRYKIAELIAKISGMKPSAIGLDIIFPEQDRTSLTTIRQNFKYDFNRDLTFHGVPKSLTDNDGYLGHVLATSPAVGARYFYFDHAGTTSLCKEQRIVFSGQLDLLSLHKATGVLCNTPKIEKRLDSTGFINNQLDEDGILRRVPLLIDNGGIISPSLPLTTVFRALDINSAEIGQNIFGPTLRFSSHVIPMTREGYVSLRFNKSASKLQAHSAVDVLNGTVNPVDIAGKIVFVGTSAAGLGDIVATVLEPMFPGVQTHAVLADNILENKLIIRPGWTGSLVFGLCLVTGIVMAVIFIRSSGPLLTLFASLALSFTFIGLSYLLFLTANIFISPGSVVLSTMILFALLSSGRFAIEKRMAYEWYKQLSNTQQVTVESMATVAETRDPETGAHIKRTQYFVKAIAEELQRAGHFQHILSDDYITRLYLSAPLHDIGKVGIPDNILLKRGSLTDTEFEQMQEHTQYGKRIIANIVSKIEGNNFLELAEEIAYSHHEKWDGSGYPRGLVTEEIPLSARIMAIADIYDALISHRCYKPPFSHQTAIAVMEEGRGVFFDPVVFDAFLRIEQSIISVANNFKDEKTA